MIRFLEAPESFRQSIRVWLVSPQDLIDTYQTTAKGDNCHGMLLDKCGLVSFYYLNLPWSWSAKFLPTHLVYRYLIETIEEGVFSAGLGMWPRQRS